MSSLEIMTLTFLGSLVHLGCAHHGMRKTRWLVSPQPIAYDEFAVLLSSRISDGAFTPRASFPGRLQCLLDPYDEHLSSASFSLELFSTSAGWSFPSPLSSWGHPPSIGSSFSQIQPSLSPPLPFCMEVRSSLSIKNKTLRVTLTFLMPGAPVYTLFSHPLWLDF